MSQLMLLLNPGLQAALLAYWGEGLQASFRGQIVLLVLVLGSYSANIIRVCTRACIASI